MDVSPEHLALAMCGFSAADCELVSFGQDEIGNGGCIVELRLSSAQTDEFIARRMEVAAKAARRGGQLKSPGWDMFLDDLYSLRSEQSA